MIDTIEISNYKSIEKVKLELGRVNLFIGENGAGKSNLLEAISLMSAAASNKLDNEFLLSRGIRVTAPQLMRSQFHKNTDLLPIKIDVLIKDFEPITFEINNDNGHYSSWQSNLKKNGKNASEYTSKKFENYIREPDADLDKILQQVTQFLEQARAIKSKLESENKKSILNPFKDTDNTISKIIINYQNEFRELPKELEDFVIYSPEQTALRTFDQEGQIEPLGVKGEGLLKLLSVLSEIDNGKAFNDISERLKVLGWFESLRIAKDSSMSPVGMDISDNFTSESGKVFDHRSANEGFLFLIFYYALLSTNLTPSFFAIDNIDTSLNPKLCVELMKQLAGLARKNNKQVLLTTHNPAVLDGMNLEDDDQRLFVVSRNLTGQTRIKRIKKPKNVELKLSEMFMRGVLGGLPKGF
ncbi:DNA replication/repair protein RecF [Pseudomonas sp. FW306-02-F02-AA]|uniref:ATPase AAA-type core domain-containing protein n=1 Tax=Pseudomonas fluorescens TaxID=294 RepID=A0A0N9WD93_PSEFL|nr:MULTISPECIES: ATP-binding protein [Pseudomonas]ALH99513.1 hypothetical protein AO353_00100 [Pseudomonas fluorescens]PMZ04607.1 DNA replication/repair protein RecF [Pseudomonas sp. FW306-02-F02-AB]PMZ07409.1 DNA replication/repair protein RecF [Pseudomonas sp. FW306-02-H06C]PMZ16669.1 DNA replication/repair protein RecF [Pseudomonas sp. FW306-02-F02-AA]PMZ19071.1 DNA replication/repair protein RecF [Pseudomonas sp. FW306-02-F08-AA]